ncbi:hypothetical protein CCP3SC15_150027 [Gammaproteobacteria bacterium]
MLPTPQINADVAHRCLAVLNKALPFKATERELAYIAVEDKNGFHELRPRARPSVPDSVKAYLSMKPQDQTRFRMADPDFFRLGGPGEGAVYLDRVGVARQITVRNKQWLKRMKEIFDAESISSLSAKVQTRLYEFDSANDPEVKKLAEMFHGEVL